MSTFYPFCKNINLHVDGRISKEDARRQEQTAREILKRLARQPGIILADEVGMGKTFVALSAAVSVALENKGKRPVVVMVPPSLKEKWPADFELFKEKCLPKDLASRIKSGRADRAVEFLKFLDDPSERRKSVLFVTHGAMSRTLTDPWVMLALIYRAIKGRSDVYELRRALSRIMGQLLHLRWVDKNGTGVWEDLLTTHPSKWVDILHRWDIDPEGDNDGHNDDDPVPRAVWEILSDIDTENIYKSVQEIPFRKSANFDQNLRNARKAIFEETRSLWAKCITQMKLRLPLLILDEAHHLKNPQTQLASLFQVQEAKEDVEEISRGALAGVFRRMLFLTATPFQLGHGELCSVLDRFTGICWDVKHAPPGGMESFKRRMQDLRAALDKAQESATTLDATWGKLTTDDLSVEGCQYDDIEKWWRVIQNKQDLNPELEKISRCYQQTATAMKSAEHLLKPWVIRHLKPRFLPEPWSRNERRIRLPGELICLKPVNNSHNGIPVQGQALLPFLLAARATSYAPDSRPVFAEGLASSYEAFLHTRRKNKEAGTDGDDNSFNEVNVISEATCWYLDKLETFIPCGDAQASMSHPKIAATVERVMDIWKTGEKVLVFCHYIATGKVLRQRISEALNTYINSNAAEQLGCSVGEVPGELERIGKRFFDEDSPVRQACDLEAGNIISEFPALTEHREELINILRRNVRTASFLVRFFPLKLGRLSRDDMAEAFAKPDNSGLTLRKLLRHFLKFLVERCGKEDQRRYIEAVNSIQTGSYYGSDVTRAYSLDELQGDQPEHLNPAVRLVNGTTKQEQRQRIMLTFNTLFYPEILVASSVMAEGVDLHLNCRYIIHHDLCWNPTTLEQRTGRIDRIGAKVEQCGQPINIYLPYIGETQDEKMYRVVMDRERWFSVVMGEDFKFDFKTTEKLAQRVPLPKSAASALAFRLEVYR